MVTDQLRDYQELARDFLRKNDRAALFLDMGLGKTASTLHALEPRHLPALVVAPKRVAESTWPTERARWRPDLTISAAKGDKAARAASLASDVDINTISFDNFWQAEEHFKQRRWRTVIIDELSAFKTRNTKRWRMAAKMTKPTVIPHLWGLTGTPSPNGLMDLWAPLYLLDRGERLGQTLGESKIHGPGFQDRFFDVTMKKNRDGTKYPEYTLKDGADKEIHGLIEDICLSMATEGRVKLPPVTFNEIRLELPPRAREAYREIAKELLANMTDLIGGEIHTAANAAVLSSRLSQICAGFLFGDDRDIRGDRHVWIHDEKIKALREIREAQDSPLLVAYEFIPERDKILEAFPEAVTADEPDVIERWNRGEIPMLVSHPKSMGHGLNLQYGGRTIVWSSMTWSLELWDQFNKRLARPGQEYPVVIHRLMMDHSVDDIKLARLEGNADIQTALLEHLESPV